jgi:hypothetical protein
MRIAYHPTGSALHPSALDALLVTWAAAWPTVSGGTLLVITAPKRPFKFEADTTATDRQTLGGRQWSKIHNTQKVARLEFFVNSTEAATWRTFYAATNGFRLPFIVEHPQTLVKTTMQGSGPFPLSETEYRMHSGSVVWTERV